MSSRTRGCGPRGFLQCGLPCHSAPGITSFVWKLRWEAGRGCDDAKSMWYDLGVTASAYTCPGFCLQLETVDGKEHEWDSEDAVSACNSPCDLWLVSCPFFPYQHHQGVGVGHS